MLGNLRGFNFCLGLESKNIFGGVGGVSFEFTPGEPMVTVINKSGNKIVLTVEQLPQSKLRPSTIFPCPDTQSASECQLSKTHSPLNVRKLGDTSLKLNLCLEVHCLFRHQEVVVHGGPEMA